jgi:hypothetical protein
LTIPGEDRIIVLGGNKNNELKYVLWGGDNFKVAIPQLLHNNLYAVSNECFNLTSLLSPGQ